MHLKNYTFYITEKSKMKNYDSKLKYYLKSFCFFLCRFLCDHICSVLYFAADV